MFFSFFMAFFAPLISPGSKNTFFLQVYSAVTYPSVIRSLREFQKTQIILDSIEVETHFSPKCKIQLLQLVLNRKLSF